MILQGQSNVIKSWTLCGDMVYFALNPLFSHTGNSLKKQNIFAIVLYVANTNSYCIGYIFWYFIIPNY